MHRYEYLRYIGKGSFGTVYKCRLRSTGQFVALKIIPTYGKSKQDLEQLKKEIYLIEKLHHPNIITFYETFEEDNNIYIATELAQTDLFDIIQDSPVPISELQQIAYYVLSVLGYLHENRIAHRDVKPQNILVCDGGKCKICDFGFARYMSNYTIVMSSIKGSPIYLAPEIARGQSYTEMTDVWSFGVMMFELATQKPPFIAGDYIKLIRLLQSPGLTVRYEDHAVFTENPVFQDFLQCCLIYNPDKRHGPYKLLNHSFVNPDNQYFSAMKRSLLVRDKYDWYAGGRAITSAPPVSENIGEFNMQPATTAEEESVVAVDFQSNRIDRVDYQMFQNVFSTEYQHIQLVYALNNLLNQNGYCYADLVQYFRNSPDLLRTFNSVLNADLLCKQQFLVVVLHYLSAGEDHPVVYLTTRLETQFTHKLRDGSFGRVAGDDVGLLQLFREVINYLRVLNVLAFNQYTYNTIELFGPERAFPFDFTVFQTEGGPTALDGVPDGLAATTCRRFLDFVSEWVAFLVPCMGRLGADGKLCAVQTIYLAYLLVNQLLGARAAINPFGLQFNVPARIYAPIAASQHTKLTSACAADFNAFHDRIFSFLRCFAEGLASPGTAGDGDVSLSATIDAGLAAIRTEMLENLYAAPRPYHVNIPQLVYDHEARLFGQRLLTSANVFVYLIKIHYLSIIASYHQCEVMAGTGPCPGDAMQNSYSQLWYLDQIIQKVDAQLLNKYVSGAEDCAMPDGLYEDTYHSIAQIRAYFARIEYIYRQLMQVLAFTGFNMVDRLMVDFKYPGKAESGVADQQLLHIYQLLYTSSLSLVAGLFEGDISERLAFPFLPAASNLKHEVRLNRATSYDYKVRQIIYYQNLTDMVSILDKVKQLLRHKLVLPANILTYHYANDDFDQLHDLQKYQYNSISPSIIVNYFSQHLFYVFMNSLSRYLKFVISYMIQDGVAHIYKYIGQFRLYKEHRLKKYDKIVVNDGVHTSYRVYIMRLIFCVVHYNKYISSLIFKTLIQLGYNIKLSFITLLFLNYDFFEIPHEERLLILKYIVYALINHADETDKLLLRDYQTLGQALNIYDFKSPYNCFYDILTSKIISFFNQFGYQTRVDYLISFKYNSTFKDADKVQLYTSTGCNITISKPLDEQLVDEHFSIYNLVNMYFYTLLENKFASKELYMHNYVYYNMNILVMKMYNDTLGGDGNRYGTVLLESTIQLLNEFDPSIQILNKVTSLALMQFPNSYNRQYISCFRARHKDMMYVECMMDGCIECCQGINQALYYDSNNRLSQKQLGGVINCKFMIGYLQQIDRIINEERLDSLNLQEVTSLICQTVGQDFLEHQLLNYQYNFVEYYINLSMTTIYRIGIKCSNISLYLATLIDYEVIHNILYVCNRYTMKNTTKVVLFSLIGYLTNQYSPLNYVLVNQAIQAGCLSANFINQIQSKAVLISNPSYAEYMVLVLNNIYYHGCEYVRGLFNELLYQEFFDLLLYVNQSEMRYNLFYLGATLLLTSGDFIGKLAGVIENGYLVLKERGVKNQQLASVILRLIRNSLLSSGLYVEMTAGYLGMLGNLFASEQSGLLIKARILEVYDVMLLHGYGNTALRQYDVAEYIVRQVIGYYYLDAGQLDVVGYEQLEQFKAALQGLASKGLFDYSYGQLVARFVK